MAVTLHFSSVSTPPHSPQPPLAKWDCPVRYLDIFYVRPTQVITFLSLLLEEVHKNRLDVSFSDEDQETTLDPREQPYVHDRKWQWLAPTVTQTTIGTRGNSRLRIQLDKHSTRDWVLSHFVRKKIKSVEIQITILPQNTVKRERKEEEEISTFSLRICHSVPVCGIWLDMMNLFL